MRTHTGWESLDRWLIEEGGRQKRLLGDEYVKTEFRRHKDVENPLFIVRFLLLPSLCAVFPSMG